MIIGFEGAPAVGKSTVATFLKNNHNYHVVPEANQLFGKQNRSSDLWYYQKQIERQALAVQACQQNKVAILDGDVFQPLWFNALFMSKNSHQFEKLIGFFSSMFKAKKITFPDRYVYFEIDENIRQERECLRSKILGKSDALIRKKINKYSDFAKKQKPYFMSIAEHFPNKVYFLPSDDIYSSAKTIVSFKQLNNDNDEEIFDLMVSWCRKQYVGVKPRRDYL